MYYSGELRFGAVLVHGLHSTLAHISKKPHEHCDIHTPVNALAPSLKLCEGRINVFRARSVKRNTFLQSTFAKRPLASRQPGCRSCGLRVNGFTRGGSSEESKLTSTSLLQKEPASHYICLFLFFYF